ncbi:MAG: hypothetical protein ACKV22_21545 [Bryobacteraceae bacterium]
MTLDDPEVDGEFAGAMAEDLTLDDLDGPRMEAEELLGKQVGQAGVKGAPEHRGFRLTKFFYRNKTA